MGSNWVLDQLYTWAGTSLIARDVSTPMFEHGWQWHHVPPTCILPGPIRLVGLLAVAGGSWSRDIRVVHFQSCWACHWHRLNSEVQVFPGLGGRFCFIFISFKRKQKSYNFICILWFLFILKPNINKTKHIRTWGFCSFICFMILLSIFSKVLDKT